MEQDRRLELIDIAIQKIIRDKKNKGTNHCETNDDDEYQIALSNLLSASQLEALQREELLKQSEASSPSELVSSITRNTETENVDADSDSDEVEDGGKCKGIVETDEIVRELKKVKRQNFVTHCLLSVMIVLTVAWQLSEVSLIMKVKDGLSHPFRSFGSMLKGMVKVPDMNGQESDNNRNRENQHESSSSTSLPSLKIPEMPHVDVTNLGFNNGSQ